MKMIGRDGTVIEVPDEKAQEAFMSRKYGFLPGARVPMRGPDGDIISVDGKDAFQAFQAGSSSVSAEEFHKAAMENQYGGIGGAAIAGAEGFGRGLTVGGFDPLAIGAARAFGGNQAAEATRQHLAGYKGEHPIAAGGGEVLGAITPILASGGAAAPLEGANLARAGVEAASLARGAEGAGAVRGALSTVGILPRAIAGAGRAAEELAANAVGHTAESLAGRTAQKLVTRAASGSIEAGLFGVGQEVSEASLGDHDLNAEKLMASFGHGAMLGGILGGGLGAIGEVASTGSRAALRNLSPRLEKQAGEMMWRSLEPTGAMTREANVRAGGASAVGKEALRAMPQEGGTMGRTVEEVLPHLQKAKEDAGKAIGDLLSKTEATVSGHEVMKPIAEIIDKLRGKALHEPIVKSMEEAQNSLAEKLGVLRDGMWNPEVRIPVQDLVEQRRAVAQKAYVEAKALNASGRVEYLRDIHRELGNLEQSAIDRAAKDIGGPTGEMLREANKRYQRLTLATEAAERKVASIEGGASVGAWPKLEAIGGLVSGHPIHGLLTAVGHKLLQERGASMAANILDKASTLGAIRRMSAKVDGEIEAAVDSALSPKARIKPRLFMRKDEEGTPRERYEQHVDRIALAAAAPKIKAQHVEKQLGAGAATHAPETMAALANTTQAGTSFMAAQIPKGHTDLRSITPQLAKPRVSDAEMDKFMRSLHVVENPMTVVHKLEEGKLTRDHVDAMKKVYPKLYEKVQGAVMDKLGTLSIQPAYAQRVQLGILLDIPTDSTLSPDFITMMQAQFSGKSDNPMGAPKLAPGPHRPIEGISDTEQTTFGAIGAGHH